MPFSFHTRWKVFAGLASIAVSGSGGVLALGLGAPLTSPLIGQPLRIEIPFLLGAGEPLPRVECVRLLPPVAAPDKQYFPQTAKVSIDAAGRPRVVIASPQRLGDPFVEFRLVVGCNAEFAKDYMVLSSSPDAKSSGPSATATGAGGMAGAATSANQQVSQSQAAAATSPAGMTQSPSSPSSPQSGNSNVITLSAGPDGKPIVIGPDGKQVVSGAGSAVVTPIQGVPTGDTTAGPAATGRPAASGTTAVHEAVYKMGNTLRLERATTLNALSKLRYPRNYATRQEYRRRMVEANPVLFDAVDAPGPMLLPAGTVLVVPNNLPPPESELAAPVERTVQLTKKPVAAAPVREPAPTAPRVEPKAPSQDRLVIGSSTGGSRSSSDLVASVDHMAQMLKEQGQAEAVMTENLAALNKAFMETRTYIQALEANTRRLEAEQVQLKSRLESQGDSRTLNVLELLALILAGGAVGAALIVLHHKMQLTRDSATAASESPDSNNTVAEHETDDDIPGLTLSRGATSGAIAADPVASTANNLQSSLRSRRQSLHGTTKPTHSRSRR